MEKRLEELNLVEVVLEVPGTLADITIILIQEEAPTSLVQAQPTHMEMLEVQEKASVEQV
jgi:hypothetical protein